MQMGRFGIGKRCAVTEAPSFLEPGCPSGQGGAHRKWEEPMESGRSSNDYLSSLQEDHRMCKTTPGLPPWASDVRPQG